MMRLSFSAEKLNRIGVAMPSPLSNGIPVCQRSFRASCSRLDHAVKPVVHAALQIPRERVTRISFASQPNTRLGQVSGSRKQREKLASILVCQLTLRHIVYSLPFIAAMQVGGVAIRDGFNLTILSADTLAPGEQRSGPISFERPCNVSYSTIFPPLSIRTAADIVHSYKISWPDLTTTSLLHRRENRTLCFIYTPSSSLHCITPLSLHCS